MSRNKVRSKVKAEATGKQHPCTECGRDAYIGYSAGRESGGDWGGKVKRGERLCTVCFRRRGGVQVL